MEIGRISYFSEYYGGKKYIGNNWKKTKWIPHFQCAAHTEWV